jgi:hypothetical protein
VAFRRPLAAALVLHRLLARHHARPRHPRLFHGLQSAKRFSRNPESFGEGRIEGVFTPETAAHASARSPRLRSLLLFWPVIDQAFGGIWRLWRPEKA